MMMTMALRFPHFISSIVVILCLAVLVKHREVSAFGLSSFSSSPRPTRSTTNWSSSSSTSLAAAPLLDRRSFWDTGTITAAALAVTTSVVIQEGFIGPVAAEGGDNMAVGDLAMPSEADQQKAQADAVAERLRIKAELQKKSAKPMTFKDNFAAEKEKQKSLEKTKEERRNALCEELGRGC